MTSCKVQDTVHQVKPCFQFSMWTASMSCHTLLLLASVWLMLAKLMLPAVVYGAGSSRSSCRAMGDSPLAVQWTQTWSETSSMAKSALLLLSGLTLD